MPTIFTNLIGSGQYSNGYVIVKPLRPWNVWCGVSTRPLPKRMKIVDQALYELDGTTPAKIVPSYVPDSFVPSGTQIPVIIHPDENLYSVEIIQNGSSVLHGYWKVPYDPADDGFTWYTLTIDSNVNQTFPIPRYLTPGNKTYTNTGTMFADLDAVKEGTIIYITADEEFWGRNNTTFVPFQGMPQAANLIRDWDPKVDISGDTLRDMAKQQHATLGSTAGADTNDPTWNNSEYSLTYDADDFVRTGGVPWD